VSALVTSLRMYNATPAVAAAWRALFERVFTAVGADVRFVDHRYPQPIAALWEEPGLCAAFMCGWPFVHSNRGLQAIAAPVPSPVRYAGLARYCSEFLVREASGWTSLEDTFAHRIGSMPPDSQSGFNAPRALLARYVTERRRTLYRESLGPFMTPAKLLDAVRANEVDVVAVDGFYLDLVRHAEPAMLAGLRTVATTPWTPIPLLVAAPGVDRKLVARLRENLVTLHDDSASAACLRAVALARFVVPDVASYAQLPEMARFAIERSYETIG
jgi:ABC-type phosphate/phosphonate transport system substrate-binding protein